MRKVSREIMRIHSIEIMSAAEHEIIFDRRSFLAILQLTGVWPSDERDVNAFGFWSDDDDQLGNTQSSP